MERPDAIIVGSGINALVCAAMLGKRGKRVLVLERNGEIGGCIRTEALTAPGFVHDVMATTWVLFLAGPAYGALGADLARHGVEFTDPQHPTGVLRPSGEAAVLTRDRAANMQMLEALADGDGDAFARGVGEVEANAGLIFPLLGQHLWSRQTATLMGKEAVRRRPSGLTAVFGETLAPARGWLEGDFRSDTAQALFAPWVLHTGLGPDSAYSGMMAKVIAFSLEALGAPIVKGGAQKMLDAFRALITEQGGEIRTDADVSRIDVEMGETAGVTLADGERIFSRQVIASVTPNQLYFRLLEKPPAQAVEATRKFRYGKGNFQLHYALDLPPQWKTEGLSEVALLHLTDGVDAVSKATNEAERGMLPEVPTICVGQPTALDPSRAPEGKAVLWLQMPEAPRRIKGDAKGEIDAPADGKWTEALCEAYADRIEAILAGHIDGFRDSVIARSALSPADIEALNMNLVGGDPYGGACALDQFFLWRPFKHSINHGTGIKGLWHIGASTHPGPGLGGASGFLAAEAMG